MIAKKYDVCLIFLIFSSFKQLDFLICQLFQDPAKWPSHSVKEATMTLLLAPDYERKNSWN